jgi:hypothetical protein
LVVVRRRLLVGSWLGRLLVGSWLGRLLVGGWLGRWLISLLLLGIRLWRISGLLSGIGGGIGVGGTGVCYRSNSNWGWREDPCGYGGGGVHNSRRRGVHDRRWCNNYGGAIDGGIAQAKTEANGKASSAVVMMSVVMVVVSVRHVFRRRRS